MHVGIGQVVGVLDDDEYSSDCEFQVAYEGDDDFTVVNLVEDWKEGWVQIMSKNEMKRKEKYIERPELFGKQIRHKWTMSDGKDEWYSGKVVRVLDDDEFSSDCEFQVQYDGYEDEEHTVVKLIEDWKLGWLEIF